MKKLYLQIILTSLFVFSTAFTLSAQDRIIQGEVKTFNTIPLVNATIKVKSSKEIVYSDTLGRFTVTCLPKDKLKVTAKGFTSQNARINDKTKLVLVNLKLKPTPESRELAIGYGHIRDRDKLDAVSSLNSQEINYSNYNNIYDIIRGRFTGVEVRGDDIVIRGGTSVLGSDAALLVLDGLIVDSGTFRSISTIDISSINVLKGSDATIYGSRGANGVVIVTTKGR